MTSRLVTLILLCIVPLQGIGLDLISPAFPTLVDALNTTSAKVELTLSTYLLGFALFQIIVGTLSDSWGRRPLLIIGMACYVVISLSCAGAHTIGQLLLLRFFQGVSVSASSVLTRTIIMDVFKGDAFRKVMGTVPIVWALGPIIAPTFGGYLNTFLGWQSLFICFAIYGFILLLLIVRFIPETHTDRQGVCFKKLLLHYRYLLSHTGFYATVLCLLCMYALIIFFNTAGPFLIQDTMGYSCVAYGNIALFMGVAFFIGNLFNRMFPQLKTPMFWMECALIGMLLSVSLMVVLSWYYPTNIYVLVIPIAVILMFSGMFYPYAMAGGLGLFTQNRGTVNALFGLFCTGGSGLVASFGTRLNIQTVFPLALVLFACIVLTVGVYYSCFRRWLVK